MKKNLLAVLGMSSLMLIACKSGNEKPVSSGAGSDTLTMLVGSYASSAEEGIKIYRFNQETGESNYLGGMKGISNPSFLTVFPDGKKVYAVGEDETSQTATANALALDADSARLTFLNTCLTRGGAPCHIAVSPDKRFVVTANYMGGSITVFPLESSGRLGEGHLIPFTGKGPDESRQEQPHLHHIWFTPDGKLLLANDLGTDCIHAFPINTAQTSGNEGYLDEASAFDIPLPAASGPRHACFDAEGKFAYVITELSGEVIVLSYDGNTLQPVQRIQADSLGAKGSADIHLSPDGNFLYASNRLKGDGLAIFKVSENDGQLTKVGYQSTGLHPRNFILTPNGKYLLVACRDTNEIEVYLRNAQTGLLEDTGKRIAMSRPVCIRWVP